MTRIVDRNAPLGRVILSPSPRDVVASLSEEEQVAIDLILERDGADDTLAKLVPSEGRRAYLTPP